MNKFTTHVGIAAPMRRADVNTDDIIPARFLKTIRRDGFGPSLFANWRYLEDGTSPDPDFVLNRAEFNGASILVADENFGCGSSREHAPWALKEYGFVCLIAPSFADIFYSNCLNNGILPVPLPRNEVHRLFEVLERGDWTLRVDLPAQTITTPESQTLGFEVDPFRKRALLDGLDNVNWSLQHSSDVTSYEQRRRQEAPWLFSA